MSQQTQQFAARHAPARVEVEYLHPDRVYDRVRAGEAEVGIVSFPRPDRELAVTPWRDEEMVLVCHPGHRLARARAVAAGELDGEAFVAFDENLGIRRQTDRFLRQHGVRVQTKLAFDNVEAIKRAVEVASGVALLPFPTLQRELASGALVAVPLRPRDFHRPLGFIHRRGRPFYPSTELFIAQLRNGVTGAGHQDK
jgi:DNA-binding transcriptional LysR family regulator